MNTRYKILAPNSGTWEHVGDEEFDTLDAARAAIVELQQQGFSTLAIRRVGERYPEILIEPLVMDIDGKALTWLETDADGNTTVNDVNGSSLIHD